MCTIANQLSCGLAYGRWAKIRLFPHRNSEGTAAMRRLADLKATGVSDRTVQCHSIILKAAFSWLYKEGLFPRNALNRLENPKIETEVRERLAITRLEFDNLVATIGRLSSNSSSRFKSPTLRKFHALRMEVMITLMIDGAMRKSEACRIPLEAVNLINGTVSLSKEITKTKKGRVCALSMDFVNGKLAEWIAFRAKIMAGCEGEASKMLFVTERREPIKPQNWGKRFDRIVREAGLQRHITTHCCRRAGSSAMDLVDRNVSKLQTGHMSDAVHDLYNIVGEAQIAKLRAAKDRVGLFGVQSEFKAAGSPRRHTESGVTT